MQLLWMLAAGGITAWVGLTYGLELLLKLTGNEVWYYRIMMWVLGITGIGALVWYRWRQKKQEKAAAQAGGPTEAGSDDEIDTLIRDAEARLAGAGQGARLGSLPVVFVVGAPGATKTSTVVHSGIEPETLAGQVYENNNITPHARRQLLVRAQGRAGGGGRQAAGRTRPLAAAGAAAASRQAGVGDGRRRPGAPRRRRGLRLRDFHTSRRQ